MSLKETTDSKLYRPLDNVADSPAMPMTWCGMNKKIFCRKPVVKRQPPGMGIRPPIIGFPLVYEGLPFTRVQRYCLVLCDSIWAKIYQPLVPVPALELMYHQVNFGGSIPEFAQNLCQRLSHQLRAGRYDRLLIFSSREFLAVLKANMDDTCRDAALVMVELGANQFTESEIERRWGELLAVGSVPLD